MKTFLDNSFLLTTKTAEKLYHDFAESLPIIDYHNHLPADQIASDIQFENITRVWLNDDHYKWRAMRANGVNEEFITGNKSDWEKFEAWAGTVPYTLRNPLYHWTHIELQRYFGIYDHLNLNNARSVFEDTTAKLNTEDYSVRRLLEKMKVRIICTTDDPLDGLAHHQKIKQDNWGVRVFPAFRPDKAMSVEDPVAFNDYLNRLEESANISLTLIFNVFSSIAIIISQS
jgi:glucuronate isomerase